MKADTKYVTFWGRFWAAFFDIALVGLIFKILDQYLFDASLRYSIAIIGTLAIYFYKLIMHALFGKTLGKMLFGLVVLKSDESPIGVYSAVIREILPIAIVSTFAIMIGPILSSNSNFEMEWQEFSNKANIYEIIATIALSIIYISWDIDIFISIQLSNTSRSIQDRLSGTVIVQERALKRSRILLIAILILLRLFIFGDIGFGN